MTAFGHLQHHDPRSAWSHEAHDFTPWLAANLDRLAEIIDIPLELIDREVRVDSYAADILARCPADDSKVLIENQLADGDHSHLGQILTYLAGLEARTVIWIARDFRAAHLSAVQWLNRHTIEGFSFFAIKLRLLRIDDSPFAPVFDVVERPNAWDRQVKALARDRQDMSEIGQFRRRFWQHYLSRHPDHGDPDRAGAASSLWLAVDRLDLVIALYRAKDVVGLFVRPGRGGSASDLALRLAPYAAQLKERLDADLDGEPSFLLLRKHMADMNDETHWDEAADWLHRTAETYRTTLSDLLQD